MNVDKIIVHQLIKNESEQRASVDISRDLLDINELSVNLVQKLDASYKKTQITYAFFDTENRNIFPEEFQNYIEDGSDVSFIQFSQNAMSNLRDKVEGISPAKGGFIVFSQYEVDGRGYVGIYLIRDTIGMLFRKDRGRSAFIINPTEHLDLDKLAMACKIDLDQYRANNGKYLSFMKRKMNDLSEYFVNWVSVSDRESNKILTQNLFSLVNQVNLPRDDNNQEISRDAFRAEVYRYVNSLPTKIVNINDLSEHFYSDETYLADFAERNNISINTEFTPVSSEMKKFVQIDLDSDGIHVQFSRKELNTKVRFDRQNRNVVIIESEQFATALRQEIDRNDFN